MAESNNNMEDLFGELLHMHPVDENGYRIQTDNKDGSNCQPFKDETVKGWYRARAYVLKKMETEKNWGAEGITVGSNNRIHIVIHYHGEPISLFIARQVALAMHFPNFSEGDSRTFKSRNTTVITILYKRKKDFDIMRELRREEYLCNLPDVCRCVKWYKGKEEETINPYSYIDIELELVGFDNESDFKGAVNNQGANVVIDEETIKCIQANSYIESLDVTNARRVNMVYNVGADIDNLSADDPNTAERYDKALLYFCYQQSPDNTLKKWGKLTGNSKAEERQSVKYQIQLRNKLSNVLCADCFEARLLSLFENKTSKDLRNMILGYETDTLAKVKCNLQTLAKCEHSRWNVEKLILGFSPFTAKEQYEDSLRFGSSRNSYRKELKNNKALHIDLCSYQDLRRRNPGDMKYDCFLMLAMVRILKERYKNN